MGDRRFKDSSKGTDYLQSFRDCSESAWKNLQVTKSKTKNIINHLMD